MSSQRALTIIRGTAFCRSCAAATTAPGWTISETSAPIHASAPTGPFSTSLTLNTSASPRQSETPLLAVSTRPRNASESARGETTTDARIGALIGAMIGVMIGGLLGTTSPRPIGGGCAMALMAPSSLPRTTTMNTLMAPTRAAREAVGSRRRIIARRHPLARCIVVVLATVHPRQRVAMAPRQRAAMAPHQRVATAPLPPRLGESNSPSRSA